jgi:3-oxoacyl-[acyl-carrier-protein] synthase-3
METAKIIGAATFLPGEPINNSKLDEVFGIRKEWIDLMIGNKHRHMCVDLDSRQVTHRLVDICEGAARRAIADAGIDADQIGMVILTTATPDHLMPATVNLVADRLGINDVPTYQLQAGCSGAFQGVTVAEAFVKSGICRNILVIGGDACYKFVDFDKDYVNAPASELVNFALFGDGAGAVVVSSDRDRRGMRIKRIVNRFEGLNRPSGHIMHWFGPQTRGLWNCDVDTIQSAEEDYKAIESHVPRMTLETMSEMVVDDDAPIDYYLMPQLAGHMTRKIIGYCGVDPVKTINCVEETGNTGNGLPLFLVEQAKNRMRSGQRALGVAIESSKWIKTAILLEQE